MSSYILIYSKDFIKILNYDTGEKNGLLYYKNEHGSMCLYNNKDIEKLKDRCVFYKKNNNEYVEMEMNHYLVIRR